MEFSEPEYNFVVSGQQYLHSAREVFKPVIKHIVSDFEDHDDPAGSVEPQDVVLSPEIVTMLRNNAIRKKSFYYLVR